MTQNTFFSDYFQSMFNHVKKIDTGLLEACAQKVDATHRAGGKIILAGNGGSAAMASHVAVDFTKAAGRRAVNFNEANLITCFANDYGYENWLSEAVKAYADPADLVILISSSGQSPNIINAAKQSNEKGTDLVTLTGFSHDNPVRGMGSINLWADSTNYNFVEMTHHIWLLSIVDFCISAGNQK